MIFVIITSELKQSERINSTIESAVSTSIETILLELDAISTLANFLCNKEKVGIYKNHFVVFLWPDYWKYYQKKTN